MSSLPLVAVKDVEAALQYQKSPSKYLTEYKQESAKFVKQLLEGNEDAPRQLRDFYLQKIDRIKMEKLYPRGDDFNTETNRPSSLTQVEMEVNAILETLHTSVETIFTDICECIRKSTASSREESRRIELRANACRKLLLLRVEVSLCRLRILMNYDPLLFNHDEEESDDIGDIMIERAKKILETYNKDISDRGKKLQGTKYPNLLIPRFDEADIFEDMSRTFGPSERLSAKEPGWARSAAHVSQELYCQFREIERRVYWQQGKKWDALRLAAWDLSTRFGYEMWRLFIVAGVSIPIFWAFYVANDIFTGSTCSGTIPWYQYLFIVVSYLTGPNSVITPCGPFTIYITTAESIAGFLLLAIAVSYLYQVLSRDR